MTADRATITAFLDALLRAIEQAAVVAFPGECVRTPRGVAVRDGGTTPVMRVMELLSISDGDAEVIFNRLPADPKVLAEYLRPRLVGGQMRSDGVDRPPASPA